MIRAAFQGHLGRFVLDVAFEAPQAGVTALFGPSGCGKTSVLRCAAGLQRLASAGLLGFALEAAPRTTRAQSMDVLSSQANIAGYKAVMIAADRYQRFFPMLMTAAGTVKAARVVILDTLIAAGATKIHFGRD